MSEQQRVVIRVNQTTAGLGEVGSTMEVDDTDYVRLVAAAGVVSILDPSPSVDVENVESPADHPAVTSSDDDAASVPQQRKSRGRKSSGGA